VAIDITQLLSFGSPIAAATAVYGLFSFLDNKASDEANQAVAAWMKGESYRRIDLGKAVIGAFDHLYGTPLFRWKAFYRSAILSTSVFVLWNLLIVHGMENHLNINLAPLEFSGLIIIVIIIADYLSLYVIRQCLKGATRSVVLSILISMIFGFLAISIVFELSVIAVLNLDHPNFEEWLFYLNTVLYFWQSRTAIEDYAPVFLVHLWLPLFLIAAMINSGLYAFFRAVGVATWFIKHGDEHPLDAIGIVAAAIVFVAAMILQVATYVLS